jgi:hypothetical protein
MQSGCARSRPAVEVGAGGLEGWAGGLKVDFHAGSWAGLWGLWGLWELWGPAASGSLGAGTNEEAGTEEGEAWGVEALEEWWVVR